MHLFSKNTGARCTVSSTRNQKYSLMYALNNNNNNLFRLPRTVITQNLHVGFLPQKNFPLRFQGILSKQTVINYLFKWPSVV